MNWGILRCLLAVLILLTTAVASGCAGLGASGPAAAPGSPTAAELTLLLARVRVVSERPFPGGYERDCTAGRGCVFGQAWTDDTDAPGGHDGCDTRNNVLNRQLTEVTYRQHTRDCVVVSGTLADPYSGRRIDFTKARAKAVQIDHVYPLAAAWDMGAARWPLARRVRFANDIEFNLLAADGAANQAKGDKTPARWLPPWPEGHCFYAGKYLTTAIQYDLPITTADKSALQKIRRRCP
ncbi:HNH endonuclease family protein [Nocardia callitridis]|uniref:HNH endonuclease family protein n=1 Tax=Nocardia callitridis TaxID=648753 RepID=A0ABP9KYX7_9NOCA